MLTRAQRDDIIADVQYYIGNSFKVGLTSTEIDYIGALEGNYRLLAIMQAALSQQIAHMGDPIIIDGIRKRIEELGIKLGEEELKAVQESKAYSDTHGQIHYIKDNTGKVHAQWDNGDPVFDKEPECPYCVDGKMKGNYVHIVPCECPLGDKWAKKTDFMGPAPSSGYISSKGFKVIPAPTIADVIPIDKAKEKAKTAKKKWFDFIKDKEKKQSLKDLKDSTPFIGPVEPIPVEPEPQGRMFKDI